MRSPFMSVLLQRKPKQPFRAIALAFQGVVFHRACRPNDLLYGHIAMEIIRFGRGELPFSVILPPVLGERIPVLFGAGIEPIWQMCVFWLRSIVRNTYS